MMLTPRKHIRNLSIGTVLALCTWLTISVKANGVTDARRATLRGLSSVFIGQDLRSQKFQGHRLAKANFESTRLADSDFSKAHLTECRIRRSEVRGSQFDGADMHGCDLRQSDFSATKFVGAQLQGADLRNSIFNQANFTHANLTDSDLRGTQLAGVVVHQTDWTRAKFDRSTRLPFSRDEAKKRGMIYLDVE